MSTTPPTDPPTTCPNCGATEPGEVFCEVCGYDFATGTLPVAAEPVLAGASGWTATVEADRTWFDANQAEAPGVAVTFPEGRAAVEVALAGTVVAIGRRSGGEAPPGIDLTDDPGVSRRHATLARQPDDAWAVVDEGSTNGTRVRGGAQPITAGEVVALADGDHLNLGAWTRITVRRT